MRLDTLEMVRQNHTINGIPNPCIGIKPLCDFCCYFLRAKLVWPVQSKYHRIILDKTAYLGLHFVSGIVSNKNYPECFVSLRLSGMTFNVTNHNLSFLKIIRHFPKYSGRRANQFLAGSWG